MKSKFKIILFIGLAILLFSCSKNENQKSDREEVRIAIILPFEENGEKWIHVLEWVKNNIKETSGIVDPIFELYDENSVDLEKLAENLSERSDIDAVFGCYYSVNTKILASKCAKSYKPVFTISTSAELIRAFGQRGFLWCMLENDASQCELLLLTALNKDARRVSLLTSDDIYGQSFIDWFSFQAVELGLEVDDIVKYDNSNIEQQFNTATKLGSDCIICVPSTTKVAENIMKYYRTSSYTGSLLFSDTACNQEIITANSSLFEGMEGIVQSVDPSSGFNISHKVKFGTDAEFGVAQLYDAVMIICYAKRYSEIHNLEFNDSIRELLNQDEKLAGKWEKWSMKDIFSKIENGEKPTFSGASGFLNFASDKNYTSIPFSTFSHWIVYEGNILNLDYYKEIHNNSNIYFPFYNNIYIQEFEESDNIDYKVLEGHWAVVVAASQGWNNYRHQADALAFYKLLKDCGYDDEHIILIMEDDIANNINNPEKGVIKRTLEGQNLYKDVIIDYRVSELSQSDLLDILSGNRENSLKSSANDNVLVFWSGHGEKNYLLWGDHDKISGESLASIFRNMSDSDNFRNILCFIESCYAGSIAKKCEGIPGMLFMTAANENETSKADIYNNTLSVWMTNRFTSVLIEEIIKDQNTSLLSLYSTLFYSILGSHVSVYNSTYYGSIYTHHISEFFNFYYLDLYN